MTPLQAAKALLDLPLSIYEAYDLAKLDGSVNFADLPLVVGLFGKFGPAIEAAKHVKTLKDLTAEDLTSLNQWVKDEFDIADDKVEHRVEKAFDIGVRLGQLLMEAFSSKAA